MFCSVYENYIILTFSQQIVYLHHSVSNFKRRLINLLQLKYIFHFLVALENLIHIYKFYILPLLTLHMMHYTTLNTTFSAINRFPISWAQSSFQKQLNTCFVTEILVNTYFYACLSPPVIAIFYECLMRVNLFTKLNSILFLCIIKRNWSTLSMKNFSFNEKNIFF